MKKTLSLSPTESQMFELAAFEFAFNEIYFFFINRLNEEFENNKDKLFSGTQVRNGILCNIIKDVSDATNRNFNNKYLDGLLFEIISQCASEAFDAKFRDKTIEFNSIESFYSNALEFDFNDNCIINQWIGEVRLMNPKYVCDKTAHVTGQLHRNIDKWSLVLKVLENDSAIIDSTLDISNKLNFASKWCLDNLPKEVQLKSKQDYTIFNMIYKVTYKQNDDPYR